MASSAAEALLISSLSPAKTHKFSRHRPKLYPKSLSDRFKIRAVQETNEKSKTTQSSPERNHTNVRPRGWTVEDVKEKSKTEQAKELLAEYGGAYLAPSITLSFALCFALVSAGVYIQSLLIMVTGTISKQVGIAADETGGRVGTSALAYAAQKAASPIRFKPTVALTPIVPGWIGKKIAKTDK